jgi:putative cell wall-binding protein
LRCFANPCSLGGRYSETAKFAKQDAKNATKSSQAVVYEKEDLSDMGREQMRNLDVAKVGVGNTVNEFEYQKHQGEMTEQEHPGQQGKDGKRLTQAERVAQITAAAHKKVEKKRKKDGAKSGTAKGKKKR